MMIREANALGIKIPEELNVVGIDNSPASEYCIPSITSIDHNAVEMGRLSVDFLIKRIEGYSGAFTQTYCESNLIVRESTRSK